jgi:hypothetical protein
MVPVFEISLPGTLWTLLSEHVTLLGSAVAVGALELVGLEGIAPISGSPAKLACAAVNCAALKAL